MRALEFHLGKIPVRIQPTFFIMAAFLGLAPDEGLLGIVKWIGIVFVSVLLHELGHATAGIAFGLEPRIDVHGMGGTTSWSTRKALSHPQSVIVSLAGPFAGFGVGVVVLTLVRFGVIHADFRELLDKLVHLRADGVLSTILYVNVGWGVFNLLPMLPLDGGNVLNQTLHAAAGVRGERIARIVSVVVAGLFVPAALVAGSLWIALLMTLFLIANWRGLQDFDARQHDAPMQASLEKAQAALEARDGARVLEFARPVALGARTAQVKAEALHLVAFGFLLEGRVADADAAIAALPQGYAPHPQLLALREAAARG
jgi:Zn-dependent protease